MQVDPSQVQPDPNQTPAAAPEGEEVLEATPEKAPMAPQKKILLLVGIVILLLGGVGGLLYSLGIFGGGSDTTTQAPAPPSPVAATPAAPATPPASTPAAPAAPAPVSTPVMPGVAVMPNAATTAALAPQPVVPDPFTGWNRIKPPPRPVAKPGIGGYTTPTDPSVPVVEMPGTLSTPSSTDTGGGGETPGTDDNNGGGGDFFGAVPTPKAGLGRNVGWIAADGAGAVTAYFQDANGKYVRLGVGSMIDTYRVKAISTEYLLLVDTRTGREERIRLTSAPQISSARGATFTTAPAMAGY